MPDYQPEHWDDDEDSPWDCDLPYEADNGEHVPGDWGPEDTQ